MRIDLAPATPGLWAIGNVWSAAILQAKNENDIVGLRECIRPLCELLLWPLMECAALLSYLVTRAFKLSLAKIPSGRYMTRRPDLRERIIRWIHDLRIESCIPDSALQLTDLGYVRSFGEAQLKEWIAFQAFTALQETLSPMASRHQVPRHDQTFRCARASRIEPVGRIA